MESIVAKNIKRLIKQKGYLQYHIGEKAGYKSNVFNAMLNGRKAIYDVDIIRISKALNVEPNELFQSYDDHKEAG